MTGRPSSFSQEIADTICERMAEGESLRLICRDDAMPARSSVFRWLRENETFRDQYAQAREDLFETWGEDVYETAMTAALEDTARARLLVDTRKWQLSKMAPKKYGDRITNHMVGKDDESEIEVKVTTDLDRAKALAAMIAKTKALAPSE